MATVDDIMNAAEDVFVASGFSGASMKRIADKAEVSKGLLYHYFPSKRELWNRVIERRVNQSHLPEKMVESVSAIAREGLGAIKEGRSHTTYFRFMRDNPQFVRMLAWLNAEEDFPCEPPMDMKETVIEKLRELQKKGIFRDDIDPRVFVIIYMALCETWFMSRSRISQWLDADMDSDEMSEIYIDTVGKILLDGMAGGR